MTTPIASASSWAAIAERRNAAGDGRRRADSLPPRLAMSSRVMTISSPWASSAYDDIANANRALIKPWVLFQVQQDGHITSGRLVIDIR